MAETLEEKVEPPEKKEKPKSTLDSVLNEFNDLVNLGIGVAAPAAGYALTGNAGVIATSAAYIAGTNGKKDSKVIRDESLSGAIFGTFAHYTTSSLKYLSRIGKLAYMIPWVFLANAFYMAEDHLIKNRTPRGLYKKLKENYWNITKKAFMLPAPIAILSAMFLPAQYLVASIAVGSFLFRKFVAGGKGLEYEDKRALPVAGFDATTRLVRNTFKGFYDTLYAIGSGIKDTLYKTAPKTAGAHP